MREKVLAIVSDNQVTIYHTDGVETACIVDGEDIQLPDDWRELPRKVVHSMPLTVRGSEMFSEDEMIYDPNHPENDAIPIADFPEKMRPLVRTAMKCPYCAVCDDNHPLGQCPILNGREDLGCKLCGQVTGEKHLLSCANNDLRVDGGDIVGYTG